MIYIILLQLLNLFNNSIHFDEYNTAIEYIKQDTLLKSTFGEKYSDNELNKICIYDTIIALSILPIYKDLIEYEYNIIDKNEIIRIRDSLLIEENVYYKLFKPYINFTLQSLSFNNNCKLKIFFSELKNNRLIATILTCNKCNDNYFRTFDETYRCIYYAFYFDDCGNIINVIYTQCLY